MATTDEEIATQIADDPDTAPDISEMTPVAEPRNLRRIAGLSQEKVAALIDVPIATYRDWEEGKSEPFPIAETLFRLMAKDLDFIVGMLRKVRDEDCLNENE